MAAGLAVKLSDHLRRCRREVGGLGRKRTLGATDWLLEWLVHHGHLAVVWERVPDGARCRVRYLHETGELLEFTEKDQCSAVVRITKWVLNTEQRNG